MSHHDECTEPAMLDDVETPGEAVDLRVIPGNREYQRSVEQNAEVVRIRRALDEVAEVHDRPFAERLLNAEFALVALAGGQRHALPDEIGAVADSAREQEVL